MRLWLTILALLAIAAAAAFGWHSLADDPGYVLVRLRGTSIETTLVFAVVALLVAWGALSLAWRLARWPFRAWLRASRRRGRERLARGLVALAEGRYALAERDLNRAAKHEPLRAPALLGVARAAHARGAEAEADRALDAAAPYADAAALALRARFQIENGRPADALALLKPRAADASLSPLGWRMLIEAALTSGDHDAARAALTGLARSDALPPNEFAALEARVLPAALVGAPDATRLAALWASLSRTQRRPAVAVCAFARRSAALGQMLAAMDEIESALRREWSDALVLCYGELGSAELAARTRTAESWLTASPNSAALLLTLGRLCRDQTLWGKAEQYLDRALAIEESAAAWEALGDVHRGQHDDARAAECYANALRVARAEASKPLGDARDGRLDTRALVFEERNEHGVPRLPGAR